MENQQLSVKCVVLGPGGVGKSAITLSFVRNQFSEEYDPTIEDSYSKTITVDEKEVVLDITDTAGQEEFRGLWGEGHIKKGEGFILVYDVTEKSTFSELSLFSNQIKNVKNDEEVSIIICGNKVDLVDAREVFEEEGQTFAKSIGAIHIETSAMTRKNIEETFIELVRRILEIKKKNIVEAPKKTQKVESKVPSASNQEKPVPKKKKSKCNLI